MFYVERCWDVGLWLPRSDLGGMAAVMKFSEEIQNQPATRRPTAAALTAVETWEQPGARRRRSQRWSIRPEEYYSGSKKGAVPTRYNTDEPWGRCTN